MPESFAPQTLAALVLAHIDLAPESPRFTPIRTGKHNASYWVDSDRGRYVLRLAPPDDAGFLFYERLMMRQEPALHALIRARTPIPVAEVTGYDFSRSRIDRDYLLLTALPGRPLSDFPNLPAAQSARALYQVGAHLRQLHALTADACLGRATYGYVGAHAPMDGQPSWAAAFQIMWNRLLDDVVACGCYCPPRPRHYATCSIAGSNSLIARSPPACCTWTCGRKTS